MARRHHQQHRQRHDGRRRPRSRPGVARVPPQPSVPPAPAPRGRWCLRTAVWAVRTHARGASLNSSRRKGSSWPRLAPSSRPWVPCGARRKMFSGCVESNPSPKPRSRARAALWPTLTPRGKAPASQQFFVRCARPSACCIGSTPGRLTRCTPVGSCFQSAPQHQSIRSGHGHHSSGGVKKRTVKPNVHPPRHAAGAAAGWGVGRLGWSPSVKQFGCRCCKYHNPLRAVCED